MNRKLFVLKDELFKFTVTREDIEDGKRNNCYECPVALGGRRALADLAGAGRFEQFKVHSDGIYARLSGQDIVEYALSRRLKEWIRMFDDQDDGVFPIKIAMAYGWADIEGSAGEVNVTSTKKETL